MTTTKEWLDELLDKRTVASSSLGCYNNTKTMEQITIELKTILDELTTAEEAEAIVAKLGGFYHVDFVYQLNPGRFYRWVLVPPPPPRKLKLENGGILVDVKILDKGIHLLFKCGRNYFHRVPLDNAIFFQKMTVDEQIYMMIPFSQENL